MLLTLTLTSMATPAVATDPLVRQRGLSRLAYDALVEAGLLDGEPVELIEGVLVEVSPQGDAHSRALRALTRWFVRAVPDPWVVSIQMPLAATPRSEPEPDLAVVTEPVSGHPTTAALVIEVAVSSHRLDLVHKPAIYAAAGVEQYWVIDPATREVVVHTDLSAGRYVDVRRQAWTHPLEFLGVTVVLADVLRAAAT